LLRQHGITEMRDYHRLESIAKGKRLLGKSLLSASPLERADIRLNHIVNLKHRMKELSWQRGGSDNESEMDLLWSEVEELSRQFVSQSLVRSELSMATLYQQYLFAARCFADVGGPTAARRHLVAAESLIDQIQPKNKRLALLELQSAQAHVLAAEGALEAAADMLEDWIDELPKPTGKSPSGDQYREAGLAQEAVGHCDKAIEMLEKAVAETERLRASVKVESRGRVLTGLTVRSYWGLIRAYAARYLEGGDEKDFSVRSGPRGC
jgi:tetratricopeptide (TPR) repeat protein